MDVPFTLNSTRNCYALSHAYVPEHIPTLMVTISQAIPFFIEDYLGFVKDNWVIFVGYPVEMRFDTAQRDDILACTLALHHPDYLWFIGLEILLLLARCCHAHQSDHYYRLDLAHGKVKSSLECKVNQATKTRTVESERAFTREHQLLVDELMRRETLPPMIGELHQALHRDKYKGLSQSGWP